MMLSFVKKLMPQKLKDKLRPVVRCVNDSFVAAHDRITLMTTLMKAVQKKKFRTSVSDNGYYSLVCYLASKYDNIFADFKRNYVYNHILEISNERENYGCHFLKMIDEVPCFELAIDDWRDFRAI